MHRLYVESGIEPSVNVGGVMVVTGEEARHAVLARRLVPGEAVEVLDGRGLRVRAEVVRAEARGRGGVGATAELVVRGIERVAMVSPAVHVHGATPKGDRVDGMIDQLSQVGAASWSPLNTERGVVDPRDSKLLRLERIAVSGAKQSGRAHVMAIGAAGGMEDVPRDGVLVVADASGETPDASMWGAGVVRLLIGPEGGWSAGEVERARAMGAKVVRFGPHAMRIETAAVVAAGVILGASRAG